MWSGDSKTNCTVVQALRHCAGRMAHRGSRGIALLFLDHGTRTGWGVSVTPRPLFIPGKDPVPIVQEAGWTPGPIWTGAENLAPNGIRSPHLPGSSQSVYWLRYPAHCGDSTLYHYITRHAAYVLYMVIRNDCRGFNNLSYTIHLRFLVISFYGVTSRIRFMFLLFPQVSRNWRLLHATKSLELTRLSC